ncbi:MAG: RtcB family protein [Planctomycetia bacterium]|nr:RtcB family protein [Planctomycetia bacterium]
MEISGKYGTAKIFNDGTQDYQVMGQLRQIMNSMLAEGTQVRVMPDVHTGKGCVIGFTQRLNREAPRISPNIVGVDLGCSVTTGRLKTTQIPDFAEFDRFIRQNIPLGAGAYLQTIQKTWTKVDRATFRHADKVLFEEAEKILDEDAPPQLALKTPILQQLKSLGSGNHFLELGRDPEGRLWLSAHSGSRQFGMTTANIYQYHAEKYCREKGYSIPGDLCFLDPETPYWRRYLTCVAAAQRFATINHQMMLRDILQNFFHEEAFEEWITSMHNYVDLDEMVLRKGAIAAHEGEACLIPFNMRDGLAVCRGKGNDDWNFSAPHGAGRLMSRSQAKQVVQLASVKEDMAQHGVYTTSLEYALDEAPDAYKPMEGILQCIEPTVEVAFLIKPLYNVKGR